LRQLKFIILHLYSDHKNVKAIWTHGGLLSTQEAIWNGVPVIGMPFFADQKPNVELLVHKGVGVRLDIATLSTESVLDAFEKVLYNERYDIRIYLMLIFLIHIYRYIYIYIYIYIYTDTYVIL